jgi:hypothetical protein
VLSRLADVTSLSSLDRRVERQEIGLAGDVVDQVLVKRRIRPMIQESRGSAADCLAK